MGTRNITVQLDEGVITRAKVAAARRGTSLSALLSRQICKLAEADERYEHAKHEALALMDEAAKSPREVPRWTREELYDR